MVLQRLWNKPIRTETNSMGPGSTARPFTTSHRTNECVPSIFPSLTPFFNLLHPPSTHTHTLSLSTSIYFISSLFSSSTPGHHEVFDFLSSFPPSIPPPSTPTFSTAPSSLCGGNRRCKGKGAAGFLSAHNICWRVR